MATLLKIGPQDHGLPVTNEDLGQAEFVGGYKYELINGRVYVTYEPDPTEDVVEKWLLRRVDNYALAHPKVINYVTDKARVFIPGKVRRTIPEPDLAAYHDFPLHLQRQGRIRWRRVSPLLVAEVLSPNDPHKDLIRNVHLYIQVPSIREYWILDAREDGVRPSLQVYRRRGQEWQPVLEIAGGRTYTTRLLPGFALTLDTRR